MTQLVDETILVEQMTSLSNLLEQVEKISDPAARETTAHVLQTMMDFHGAALTRLIEQIHDAGPLGESLLKDLATDDLISSLLLLYNLHPLNVESRIQRALEKLRPQLASHGATVELLRITEEHVVHLRFNGKSHGCHSTAAALKNTIEQSLYDKAPEITAIDIAGLNDPEPESGFVSVEQLISATRAHSTKGKNHAQA